MIGLIGVDVQLRLPNLEIIRSGIFSFFKIIDLVLIRDKLHLNYGFFASI